MSATLRDPNAYLQQRVALFARVTWAFFIAVLAIDISVPAEGEALLSSTRIASLMVLFVNTAVWLYTRRGKRPAWACRGSELASIGISMLAFATLPVIPPVAGAGGAMALFSPVTMAVVVLLRSATIPSRPWLSVVVGLVWGGVMTACAVLGWEGITIVVPGQPAGEPWYLPFSICLFATLAFSFVAGVISHVVYGLQIKVREAMQYGQYTLEAKLGEGGMGAVYRARHQMMRRPTAVKLLRQDRTSDRDLARFEREVQLTTRLTHPNTITIFDYGRTDDGTFYYVMELLNGAALDRIADVTGAQPAERVIEILRQVAGALEEAHGVGLVHRDIKPANIILCSQGGKPDVAKLVDFGLVKAGEVDETDVNLTSDGTITGTPLYMAPEVISSPHSFDGRSDIYSLGAVGYYLLTAEHVFVGESLFAICAHHLQTPPTPPSERLGKDMPADLERVILDCLQKAPEDRPVSAADLIARLEACSLTGAWSVKQAREWWDEYGPALRTPAFDVPEEGSKSIAIDLADQR